MRVTQFFRKGAYPPKNIVIGYLAYAITYRLRRQVSEPYAYSPLNSNPAICVWRPVKTSKKDPQSATQAIGPRRGRKPLGESSQQNKRSVFYFAYDLYARRCGGGGDGFVYRTVFRRVTNFYCREEISSGGV